MSIFKRIIQYPPQKNTFTDEEREDYDVLGSYTGNPEFGQMPEQDADDL